jgi:hypothetical protein
MKSTILTTVAVLAVGGLAIPTHPDYTPPGGWESVKYPPGTGEGLEHYPPPKGGWESVKYPPGTGAGQPGCPPSPFHFSSTYSVKAVPEEVVDSENKFTGGLKGAVGYYNFGISSEYNTICYNITLYDFKGNYQSPAKTATHIHEGAKGKAGPPRIAFPNPVPIEHTNKRVSIGCITGPFITGVVNNGKDSGEGFHVSQIEKNPSGFFADVHSSLAVPGAVRGQLA